MPLLSSSQHNDLKFQDLSPIPVFEPENEIINFQENGNINTGAISELEDNEILSATEFEGFENESSSSSLIKLLG